MLQPRSGWRPAAATDDASTSLLEEVLERSERIAVTFVLSRRWARHVQVAQLIQERWDR